MASLRYRLAMLEGATKHRLKPSVRACVLILTCEATPDQQAAIAEAKRTRRPVLVIRGVMPALPEGYGVILEAGELCGGGSPKPDVGPLMRSSRWE